jgi:hypothetical protein
MLRVSLSEAGSVVIDGERAERDVEVETDALSFLKGRVRIFAPFFMFFLRDAVLLEREDLVEEAAVDLGIVEERSDNFSSPFRPNLYYTPRAHLSELLPPQIPKSPEITAAETNKSREGEQWRGCEEDDRKNK